MLYRSDIDGLRSLAVIPVVLFHAGLGFSGGFVGVDVFFVISGFLITGIIRAEIAEGRFSILRFYERRARRLFPALFAMLAAVLALACAVMIPSDLMDVARSAAAAMLFASNIHFFLDIGYFNEAGALKPLLHTWSLAVEEQYYLLFPPALVVVHRLLGGRGTNAALAIAAAASFGLCVWGTARYPDAAFYLPFTRAWELLLGALVAAAPPIRAGWAAGGLGLLGVAAIVWSVAAFTEGADFPGWRAAIPALGAAAIILAGGVGPAARLLSLRPFVMIGKLSYSLYLWHWPVIVFASYGAAAPLGLGARIGCVALAVLLASLSLRFVETPFRTGRIGAGRARIFAWNGVGGGLVLAAAAALVIADGAPRRFSANLRAADAAEGLLHDRRDCHFLTVARLRADDVCIRGAAGVAPSFALVGDSHADALSPGLFAAARDAGAAGWQITGAGLQAFPDRWRPIEGGPTPISRAIIRFLEDRPEAKTVILSGYWSYYATGNAYRHKRGLWVDAAYDGSGPAYNPRSLKSAIAQLAARFPDRRFVLLDDAGAGPGLHLKTYARIYAVSGARPPSGVSLAEAARQRATYELIFKDLAAQSRQIAYLPVHAALCSAWGCPLFDGRRRALYRDGDHLSVHGAMILRDGFRAMLRDQRRPTAPAAISTSADQRGDTSG